MLRTKKETFQYLIGLIVIILISQIQIISAKKYGINTSSNNNNINEYSMQQQQQPEVLQQLHQSHHHHHHHQTATSYFKQQQQQPTNIHNNNDVKLANVKNNANSKWNNNSKAQPRHKPFKDKAKAITLNQKLTEHMQRQRFKQQKQQHHQAKIKSRKQRSVFHVRWNPNERFIVESFSQPAINSSKLAPHPRLKVSKTTKLNLNPKLYACHDKYSQLCGNKTQAFKERIIKNFEKSMLESLNESNFYNVDFKPVFGESFEEQYYPSTCLVMEAGVRVLRRKDPPFNKLKFGKLFPKQKLLRQKNNVKSCAIVSSAGSMVGSKLGRFIDSHDIVMRFNHAPTLGYEVDVGSKTSIRVLNSQVVTKPEFDFTHAPIFQNVTIAAWDPGKYNGTLEDWLTTSDYDLFTNYELYRRRYTKSRAFLIDPHSIWRLWQSLQMFAGNKPIRKNPPSSGFIGLALLLPHCPIVDFIEYIPSTRLNGRCHYYSKEINSACTFGVWHPLAAEKLMALDMNASDDMSVFQHGILRIKRPDRLLCGFNFLGY